MVNCHTVELAKMRLGYQFRYPEQQCLWARSEKVLSETCNGPRKTKFRTDLSYFLYFFDLSKRYVTLIFTHPLNHIETLYISADT